MDNITVTVQELDLIDASAAVYNTATKLSEMEDVDISGKINGSVLVYSTAFNKWKATTTLDLQNMEGGEY